MCSFSSRIIFLCHGLLLVAIIGYYVLSVSHSTLSLSCNVIPTPPIPLATPHTVSHNSCVTNQEASISLPTVVSPTWLYPRTNYHASQYYIECVCCHVYKVRPPEGRDHLLSIFSLSLQLSKRILVDEHFQQKLKLIFMLGTSLSAVT